MRRDDVVARILGIVVFLGGVGLLAFVFSTAYGWFTSPSAGVQMAPATGSTTPTSQLGASVLRLLVRLGLLLIMTIIGALLAGRGAHLYFAASNAHTPSIAPKDD